MQRQHRIDVAVICDGCDGSDHQHNQQHTAWLWLCWC
jgi:hypothetical protein